ncbi:MAG: hypothetical protein ACLPTL_05395 [Steroidobacteraceae bacterium]
MRGLPLALTLLGLCAQQALAGDAQLTVLPNRTVFLDGPADLARLRATNPGHYARAVRVLAAANHLCRPGAGQLQRIVGSRDVQCAGQLLLTSNPPQWRLTFTLDDTRYIALVLITDDPPHLLPAR